jgi:LysR family transcriptional regulator, glycine cleavage system transcriptional activator
MRRALPPLNAVRAFEAAARHLSFTRAAGELCVTPSAVGQSVRALERWLGVPLFARDRRSSPDLRLSEAGRAYLPLVGRSLDWLAAATVAVRRQPGPAREVLSVSSRPAFAMHWLVPHVVAFQLDHPELEVRVATAHGGDALAAEEGADVAVRYGRPGAWAAPFRVAPLIPDALTPVASPAVAASLRSPADLAAAPLIHSRSAPEDWAEWALACGEPALAAQAGGPAVADRSLAIEAALAGRGVALCDLTLVRRLIEAGALAAPFPDKLLVRGTAHCLVWREDREEEPKIALFRDWIIARCGGGATAA